MLELPWQKSTYSAQGANCVYVAATPTGTIHLRESDEPHVTLNTSTISLNSLILALKAAA